MVTMFELHGDLSMNSVAWDTSFNILAKFSSHNKNKGKNDSWERSQLRVQAQRAMRRRAMIDHFERFLAVTPCKRQRQREETPAPPAGSRTTYREGVPCPMSANGQVVRRTSKEGVNYLGCSCFRPGAEEQDHCPFFSRSWMLQQIFWKPFGMSFVEFDLFCPLSVATFCAVCDSKASSKVLEFEVLNDIFWEVEWSPCQRCFHPFKMGNFPDSTPSWNLLNLYTGKAVSSSSAPPGVCDFFCLEVWCV